MIKNDLALSEGNAEMAKAGYKQPEIELSKSISDEIKTTTCYMCACRCGIKVYLKDNKVKYIEGNRDHPVNKGVLCGKGAAGIMQHYSPARLKAPLKRVGPRGSGEFEEISWDEALTLATSWLSEIRNNDPRKMALFTGRDQSQALTGWWASQFGTPNFAAHGGFCSVNMAAAGLHTFGGSFWEFGEPDWDLTEYFMLWGVAEDHASNPIKKAIGKLKKRGVKITVINPIRTGYGAVADEWIGIKPGTDGLFAGALIHQLLVNQAVDIDYLQRYTNATWLVINSPGAEDFGLIARDDEGNPLAFDIVESSLVNANQKSSNHALHGEYTLPDGRKATPSFSLIANRFLSEEYSPKSVSIKTGVAAETIIRIADELAKTAFEKERRIEQEWTDWNGVQHSEFIGRPVSMHAMRGISAHSNGFNSCRIIHYLQILLGAIDCPGGFRYKPPFPKAVPPALRPAGKLEDVRPGEPMPGAPLGFVTSPSDLLVDHEGNALRIDNAYSWEAPFSAHGLMHMVIHNAANQKPYNLELLFLYMANMGWNSSMDIPETLNNLTKINPETGEYAIPRIIYSDAYYSETIAYADLILPDTTYLERWDAISLLDRPISEPNAAIDAIRNPVVEPDRDVRPFQTVLIELGARLGLPGMINNDGSPKYTDYADYITNHERGNGIGTLAGWRGEDGDQVGVGSPNQDQLKRYQENNCFFSNAVPSNALYFKHANMGYLKWAKSQGFINSTKPIIFELYNEALQKFRLSADGKFEPKVPRLHQKRISSYFDPIAFWYPPLEESKLDGERYRFHAISQRPMHMYHSWGSQNAWLRQISNANKLYMNRKRGAELDLKDDDWIEVSSHIGKVLCQVKLMSGCQIDTVWTWNAIGKRAGAWGLNKESPEFRKGFLLNHLISALLPEKEGGFHYSNSDPITGQAAWYDLKVHIQKAKPSNNQRSEPYFLPIAANIKRK